MNHTIDATGKKLGRVASEAAKLLMGKHTTEFARNKVTPIQVVITNASKASIDETKKENKTYKRYSGFPGGQTVETLGKVASTKGYAAVFRQAVKGMLPKNKLQARMLKNLTITE